MSTELPKIPDPGTPEGRLRLHNDWRRGSIDTEQIEWLTPTMVGEAIDAVLAEGDRLQARASELETALFGPEMEWEKWKKRAEVYESLIAAALGDQFRDATKMVAAHPDTERLDWLDAECEVMVLTACFGTPIVQHNAFLNREHAGKLRAAIDAAMRTAKEVQL